MKNQEQAKKMLITASLLQRLALLMGRMYEVETKEVAWLFLAATRPDVIEKVIKIFEKRKVFERLDTNEISEELFIYYELLTLYEAREILKSGAELQKQTARTARNGCFYNNRRLSQAS